MKYNRIIFFHFLLRNLKFDSLFFSLSLVTLECYVYRGATLSCIEHDRLPFSDILGAPRVLSAPQLMFYLLPLAPRILKSGETYL